MKQDAATAKIQWFVDNEDQIRTGSFGGYPSEWRRFGDLVAVASVVDSGPRPDLSVYKVADIIRVYDQAQKEGYGEHPPHFTDITDEQGEVFCNVVYEDEAFA